MFHNNLMTGAIHSFTLLPVDRTNDLAKPHQMCIESNKILLAIRTHYKGIKDDIITKHFIALFSQVVVCFLQELFTQQTFDIKCKCDAPLVTL